MSDAMSGTVNEKMSLAEMLTDCSIDRVMAIDLDWNIISWNQASEIASGLSKKDVIGKNLLEIFPSLKTDKELMHAIHSAFLGKKTFVLSDKAKLHRYYYENHFIPLKENSRKVIGVMNIMHDVAHRIKAENQLKELNTALAEKYKQLEQLSQELNTFTSITTNNIKEPLKFIYTSLELLVQAEGRHLSDSSKANLRRMQVSLNRINRLIDDIADLFKINGGTNAFVPVDLNEVVEKAKQQLNRKITERNVTLNAGSLPTINGIAEMLQLLFVHLIDNAIKFQPEGKSPEIEISASEFRIDEATGIADPNGSIYMRVTFRDNGIGIPADARDRVFVMFEQLQEKKKFPGSGLGLTFCKKIMNMHEGFINVDSESDQGSAFHCYFPFKSLVS